MSLRLPWPSKTPSHLIRLHDVIIVCWLGWGGSNIFTGGMTISEPAYFVRGSEIQHNEDGVE